MADVHAVHAACTDDPGAVLGINDRLQLAAAKREFGRRCARELLREGVTLADADCFDVRGSLACGRDEKNRHRRRQQGKPPELR